MLPNKTQHQRVAAEEILSRDLRCLVTLTNCVFHVNASHVCSFFLFSSPTLFRKVQGEMIPHYRELLLFATGSAGKLRIAYAPSLVLLMASAEQTSSVDTNVEHKNPSLQTVAEDLPLKSSFLQSLHASVKDEETLMLNVYRQVPNSAFESLIVTSAVQIPDILCQPWHRD